jgi:hypothetical protein
VTDVGVVSFHRFPTLNREQRALWIEAVRKTRPEKVDWEPTIHSRVCSGHAKQFLSKFQWQ